MSVYNSVRFCYLISQLTEKETRRLLSSITNEVLIKALFYYVLHQCNYSKRCTTDSNLETAEDVIQMTSNIIQSREATEDQIRNTECKCIDQLPLRLIGNVSSYFQRKDYESCSQTNRTLYMGCNTPTLLQSVDTNNTCGQHQMMQRITQMPRYPFAKHVTVQISDVTHDEISMNRARSLAWTLREMHRVRSLSIKMQATSHSICAFEGIAETVCENAIKSFSEQIEFLGVSLNSAGNGHPYWFSSARFAYALIRFCNIKYLSLTIQEDRVVENVQYEPKWLITIKYIFTNLLGLHLQGMDEIGETVLRTNHNSLRYLSIALWGAYEHQVDLLNSLRFPNLKELQFCVNDLSPIICFVENASSIDLEQMSLDMACGTADNDMTDPESMELVLETVITNYLSLKYLKVCVWFGDGEDGPIPNTRPMTASIFKGIRRGLMNTKILARDIFKIYIDTVLQNTKDKIKFMEYLDEMIILLKSSNIKDFILRLQITGKTINMDTLQCFLSMLDELDISEFPSESAHSSDPSWTFVITNKGSKTNGYGDQWFMTRHVLEL